jgi:hypothetical protein
VRGGALLAHARASTRRRSGGATRLRARMLRRKSLLSPDRMTSSPALSQPGLRTLLARWATRASRVPIGPEPFAAVEGGQLHGESPRLSAGPIRDELVELFEAAATSPATEAGAASEVSAEGRAPPYPPPVATPGRDHQDSGGLRCTPAGLRAGPLLRPRSRRRGRIDRPMTAGAAATTKECPTSRSGDIAAVSSMAFWGSPRWTDISNRRSPCPTGASERGASVDVPARVPS